MEQQENMSKKDAKTSIQIFLKTIDGKSERDHFDCNRADGFKTNIDAGYEYLNLHEDSVKIALYKDCDVICFNNERKYKVVKREFQPCIPVTLYLYLEEIIE
ncbi:MAG: hypothetical protein IJ147_01665 [Lachnospiraceae bacterium]|nr:hypothetical protein [Lachnospiraceae bacterium]